MLPGKDDEGRQVFILRPGDRFAVFHIFVNVCVTFFIAHCTEYTPSLCGIVNLTCINMLHPYGFFTVTHFAFY